jgi:hypothetical protein
MSSAVPILLIDELGLATSLGASIVVGLALRL